MINPFSDFADRFLGACYPNSTEIPQYPTALYHLKQSFHRVDPCWPGTVPVTNVANWDGSESEVFYF